MGSPEDDEIARLREEVAAATRAREALLAGVAHDLRNPLNTFAMSTGLLKDDLERDDIDATRALSLVKRMERAADRMQRLIDELAFGSRIEAKKIDLAPKREDVASVVAAAVKAATPQVAEKNVTISASEVDASLAFSVDRERMVQAIVAAVAFVLKGVADGGRILIEASAAGDPDAREEVVLAVRGENSGRAPTSTPSPDEGRGGLSLLIARGLVVAHGGQLAVDGGQATITIQLPRVD
jgi:signal transduction histidine kinase